MIPRVCCLEHSFTDYRSKKFVRKIIWTCIFYQWFLIAVYHKSIIVRKSMVFSNWVTIRVKCINWEVVRVKQCPQSEPHVQLFLLSHSNSYGNICIIKLLCMHSWQKHLCCKKRHIQDLQVALTITPIERTDILVRPKMINIFLSLQTGSFYYIIVMTGQTSDLIWGNRSK